MSSLGFKSILAVPSPKLICSKADDPKFSVFLASLNIGLISLILLIF